MTQKATGALALLGSVIDGPSSKFSVGQPGIDQRTITAPTTAPTAAEGAAGNLTGVFLYRAAFGTASGALTAPGPWTTDVYVGAGLNDATFGGLYTGDIWEVTLSANTPDKFTWTKNGGTASAAVTIIAGVAIPLSDGVTITFAAATGHTIANTWTRGAGLTLSAHKAELTAIPVSANALCTRRVMERAEIIDGHPVPAVCGTLYDNTTTIFTDDVSDIDESFVLPTVSQPGSNEGFIFLEPDSFDYEPEFSTIPVVALKGTAGKPRAVPGPIKLSGSAKLNLRLVDMFPYLIAGAGLPDSIAAIPGEPTVVASWSATTSRRNPRTISLFAYDGSPDVTPALLYQNAVSELALTLANAKIIDISVKLEGCNYGLGAPARKISGTGTWLGSFVLMGQRYDDLADTQPIRIKITQVLTNSTVKFKVTRGSGGSYTASDQTITVDTAARQTRTGQQFSDGIELLDENGNRLGADFGANRQPLLLIATAAITSGLHVDDIYEFPLAVPVPGVGTTPYSGAPAFFQRGPRLTDAHVTLFNGTDFLEAQSGTVTLKFPKRPVTSLGPGARSTLDMPNEGFFEVDLSISRFLDSVTYRQIMRTDDRVSARVLIEGERIPINPGVLSAYREALYIDIPQLVLTSVKAPKSGQTLIQETIAGSGEQPDNPSYDLWSMLLQTRSSYPIPA